LVDSLGFRLAHNPLKFVFLSSFLVLLAASAINSFLEPRTPTGLPTLYWVTDPNPARTRQIELFQKWLAIHHPTEQYILKVDAANADPTKRVIQAVSGIADDLIDTYSGGELRYFQAMGATKDLTTDAMDLNFGPQQTFPATEPDIYFSDAQGFLRQYAFPCNVNTSLLFVNRKTFQNLGVAQPPVRWSLEQFQEIGSRFVAAGNPDPRQRTVFFCDSFALNPIRRSLGQDIFNETGTRCILDRPGGVAVLQLDYEWTRVYHLIPTTGEKNSVSTAATYGGSTPQLFNSGNYGMVFIGRYLLVALRSFDQTRRARGEPPLDLGVAEPPNGGFPNTDCGGRFVAVYAGGKHQRLAEYFLQFLTSAEYNMETVDDPDALPPNPIYTETEAFVHPTDYPNEWSVHRAFAEAARNLSIGDSYSPFVASAAVLEEDNDAIDMMMNDLLTPEQAARRETDRINSEIQRNLDEDPSLRAEYDRRIDLQKKIDARRASGKTIPLAWLEDPFYRKYYQFKGWAQ